MLLLATVERVSRPSLGKRKEYEGPPSCAASFLFILPTRTEKKAALGDGAAFSFCHLDDRVPGTMRPR